MKTRQRISGHRRKSERGNALIEFALCSVVLFLLSCGVADFARLVTLARLADGGATAGTQYGALSPAHYGDLQGMQDAATAATGNYTGATASATQFCACSVGGSQVSCPASCRDSENPETYINVTVTIPFTAVINYPMIPNPVNITSSSTVRVK